MNEKRVKHFGWMLLLQNSTSNLNSMDLFNRDPQGCSAIMKQWLLIWNFYWDSFPWKLGEKTSSLVDTGIRHNGTQVVNSGSRLSKQRKVHLRDCFFRRKCDLKRHYATQLWSYFVFQLVPIKGRLTVADLLVRWTINTWCVTAFTLPTGCGLQPIRKRFFCLQKLYRLFAIFGPRGRHFETSYVSQDDKKFFSQNFPFSCIKIPNENSLWNFRKRREKQLS